MPYNNFLDRIKHAWNVFRDRDQTNMYPYDLGPSSSTRPDRLRRILGTERSMATPLYNRIALDVASVTIQHVRTDPQNGSYVETIDSGLNNCLTLEANIDQTGRNFVQDIVMSMFDEGSVAIVAVDTTSNPSNSSYDVQTMRTGKITEWMPYHVRINLYNERHGVREDIISHKRDVAIIENPLYAIMNEPNSTLKRLIYKLSLLDSIDEQSSSGKLDLIIQLPYVVKTPLRKTQAQERRRDIEDQLKGSKYGIAYIDGTEKVTQLNRPAENNLMTQIEYLTSTLYSQLGLAESIFNGTADEKTMINYHNGTIEPILSAITEGMKRSFLTKTGRTQGQSIAYFKDVFSLSPLTEIATAADTFTRNAILSSNEFRSVMGYRPSDDPEADKLVNKNLNPSASKVPDSNVPSNPIKGEITK